MSSPAIDAQGLLAGYRSRRRGQVPVVGPLDATVNAGELICLLGPNGSGKSTLLRTLGGFQRPLAGQVRLLGDPMAQLGALERARRRAVVLTERVEAAMLRGRDVVALGRYPHSGWSGRLDATSRQAVERSLAAVGAEHLADAPLAEMSDGERQRVLVARALAQEPAVLLLDEPTAFLDIGGRLELMRILAGLDVAVVIATHEVELAVRVAHTLWVLEGGNLHVLDPAAAELSDRLDRIFATSGVLASR